VERAERTAARALVSLCCVAPASSTEQHNTPLCGWGVFFVLAPLPSPSFASTLKPTRPRTQPSRALIRAHLIAQGWREGLRLPGADF